ncbi:MAG: MgtC/SapB family protein [Rhodopirellula sp. JB044]|uniref:MgtC/SapB family protein n=1 Tax=Rhodopirellula sp. JB044 TaxID=3342844 RepID=UPI00370B85F0
METYLALAISLGLGLLVGMQREWKVSEIAGIRTFPLITLFGTLCTTISPEHSEWMCAAGVLSICVLLAIANFAKFRAGQFDAGMTTEVSALLMFGVGCATGVGQLGPAIVTSGIAAVLLHWKRPLHGIVGAMSDKDLKSIMNLVLIGLVILPVLPDKTYGPYDVLNPFDIWRMVVLIVGISMVAYVAYKLLGARVGAILGGVLGGLISSTATTVSYARQTKDTPSSSPTAALVIMIASTIVNFRVLMEIGLVAPSLLSDAALPICLLLTLMAIECIVLYLPIRGLDAESSEQENPAQLKPAIIFGALYAVVLFIVAAAKEMFGDQALYWIAAVSGLTDMDAITLSAAKMFNENRLDASTAWRVIVVAILSNLFFKASAVAILGTRNLFAYVATAFAIATVGGVALLYLWPDVKMEELLR